MSSCQLLENIIFSGIPWLYKPIIINARQFTNEDFMMSETLGLVKTLGWKVVDGIILTIQVYLVNIYFLPNKLYGS